MSALRRPTGSIVGRADDIRAIHQALTAGPLVNLVGPGGVGKTTLAAEVIHEVEPEYGRVVIVELAAVDDRADLIRMLSGAISEGPSDEEQIVAGLSLTPTLLVFDNCEHLIDEVARLISVILAEAPAGCGLTILTTSRRPLDIADEVTWTVEPLAVPPRSAGPGSVLGDAELTAATSVQLFLERTRQAVPSFELSDANRPLIAEICAAADGVPLVLELAAALVRSRPLDEILRAMTEHPAGLAGSRRDRAEHQRSLVASLDWSRRFLRAADARLLNLLSVFVGGFTAGAARCIDPEGTADGLARLVDHSLIGFDQPIERYRMLEVVRLDAQERLSQDDLSLAEAGHTQACLAIVSALERERYEADPDNVFPRYDMELPNLAAALRRASERGDLGTVRALLGPIAVWWVHGMAPEDPAVWEKAFADIEAEAGADRTELRWRGNIIAALAFYWSHRGRHERALSYARSASELHRRSRSVVELVMDETAIGNALSSLGDRDGASAAFERALELGIASGRPYPELAARVSLTRFDPDGERTAEHLMAAQALASAGFGVVEAATTNELALYELRSGRLLEAKRLNELALGKARSNGHAEVVAAALCGQGRIALVDGDVALAAQSYQDALAIGRRTVHHGVIESAEAGLASLPPDWEQRRPIPGIDADIELSERELSVARLLRGDLTQREIADELYIAPSTVKTHIKSIYRKLGVTKRSYAVTRATELGLFD